jgi:hypothetical protein
VASSRKPEEISWEGRVRAGRVLFGARAEELLDGAAWRKELKRAFKRRALETHPDRARSLGRAEAELAREFRLVVEAYQLLLDSPDVARVRTAPPRPRTGPPPPVPRASPPPRRKEPAREAKARSEPAGSTKGPAKGVAKGSARSSTRGSARSASPAIPPRAVRLGEYLYYSRRIPFDALIDAIAWQRSHRPRVGLIAVECGFLTNEQVLEVLDRRRRAHATEVPFAEYATRIGLLTPFARLAVLGRQGKLQRKIGRFFVERGWVTEAELAEARGEMALHNAKHAGR